MSVGTSRRYVSQNCAAVGRLTGKVTTTAARLSGAGRLAHESGESRSNSCRGMEAGRSTGRKYGSLASRSVRGRCVTSTSCPCLPSAAATLEPIQPAPRIRTLPPLPPPPSGPRPRPVDCPIKLSSRRIVAGAWRRQSRPHTDGTRVASEGREAESSVVGAPFGSEGTALTVERAEAEGSIDMKRKSRRMNGHRDERSPPLGLARGCGHAGSAGEAVQELEVR
jgi:hypothetical protein